MGAASHHPDYPDNVWKPRGAVAGVSDHGGWAILVTASGDGKLLDRRRVELVDEGLPKIPHHVEGQILPIDQAVQMVERVRRSAERHSKLALDSIATAAGGHISGLALRQCPELPPTIAERIQDSWARNNADWVMYRQVLARAAEARGWAVHWYDPKKVLSEASQVLRIEDFDAYFLGMRRTIGAPWSKDHKIALAAAIVGGSFL